MTALIKLKWCVLLYCCACLHPNTTLMETWWITVYLVQFQRRPFQRDFAVKPSQSVLEAEHFSFYLLVMCKDKHNPHTTAKMTCWIGSNLVLFSPWVSLPVFFCAEPLLLSRFLCWTTTNNVLNNHCFKRNDQLSCAKLSKTSKMLTLSWFDKCQHSHARSTAISRWMW